MRATYWLAASIVFWSLALGMLMRCLETDPAGLQWLLTRLVDGFAQVCV